MRTTLCILATCALFGCNVQQTPMKEVYGKAVITASACSREHCETALRTVAPKEVEGLATSEPQLLGNVGDTLIVCVMRKGSRVSVSLNYCNQYK